MSGMRKTPFDKKRVTNRTLKSISSSHLNSYPNSPRKRMISMNLNKCINKFPTKQRLSTWERLSHPNLSIQCPQSPSLTHSLWDWRNLMLTNLLTLSPSPNNPAGQKRVLNYQNRLASHSRVQWGHQRRYWIGNQAMREREWRNRYRHQSRKLQRKLILLMNMMNSSRKRISKGSPKTNVSCIDVSWFWIHLVSLLSHIITIGILKYSSRF